MNDFSILESTNIQFGRGKELEAGKLVKFYGGSKVLILYNENSSLVSESLLDKVRRSLDLSGVEFVELGNAKKNQRMNVIEEGVAACIKGGVDFILAVGDGYCFSAAKSISACVFHPTIIREVFAEYFYFEEVLPVGCIVTVPDGGLVNSGYMSMVIPKTDGTLEVLSKNCNMVKPKFTILNPEVVNTSHKVLISSIINISSRVLERYLSPSPAEVLTDRFYESIIATLVNMWQRLQEIPNDYESYANIMWAGIMANAIPSISDNKENKALERIRLGFTSLYDCTRAEALSLILPAYLEMSSSNAPLRLAQIGNRALGLQFAFQHPENTATQTLIKLRRFIKKSGMPHTFEDLGGSCTDIQKLLDIIDMSCGGDLCKGVKFDRNGVEILLSLILLH